MHEVLVNRLGGLSLPRKSVVRLTDRPDMTLEVYRGRKTTMQQQQLFLKSKIGSYRSSIPSNHCRTWGCAMVLGKLPVLGRLTNLDFNRVGWLVGFGFNGPLRQYFSLYRAVSQREGERGWLVGCFGFNGPLRQYFSLYRAVSQREGERKEKR